MNTNNGTRNMAKMIFRKLSILMDETVWQFALVGVMIAAMVNGVLSIGGGTIA